MEKKKKKNSDIQQRNTSTWIFLGWLVFSFLWFWYAYRICPFPPLNAYTGELVSYSEHLASNGLPFYRNPVYIFIISNVAGLALLLRTKKRLLLLLMIPVEMAACFTISGVLAFGCEGYLQHKGTIRFDGKTYHLARSYNTYFDPDGTRHNLYLYECEAGREQCYRRFIDDDFDSGSFASSKLRVVDNQLRIEDDGDRTIFRLDTKDMSFELPELEPINLANTTQIENLGEFYFDNVEDMKWSSSGDLLAVAGNNALWFHSIDKSTIRTQILYNFYDADVGNYQEAIALSVNDFYFASTAHSFGSFNSPTQFYSLDTFASIFAIEDGGGDVEYSPNGQLVATTDDRSISLYDAVTFEKRDSFSSSQKVTDLLFSPNSQYLGVMSQSSGCCSLTSDTFRIWDITNQEEVFSYQHEYNLYLRQKFAFSPDSHFFAMVTEKRIGQVQNESYIRIFHLETQSEFLTLGLPGDSGTVNSVIWSSDGSMIIASTGVGLWFWDSENGSLVHAIGTNTNPYTRYNEHGMNRLALSSDGTRLATSMYNGGIRFWGVPATGD